MSKTIKYTDKPIKAKVMRDFLPKPEDLVFKEEDNVKITISLSKSSIAFFKAEAKKHHTAYQAMIRTLLDAYARHYHE